MRTTTTLAVLAALLLLIAVPVQAGSSTQKLTGGCVGIVEYPGGRIGEYTVQVNVTQHADGRLTGGIRWHEEIRNAGVITKETSVRADADELTVVGDTAYLRAGNFYFVAADGGEGANRSSDVTSYFLYLGGGSPPPLAAQIPLLQFFLSVAPAVTTIGNLQVKG